MPITRRKAVVTVIGIVLIGWWMLLPPPAQPTPAWQSSSPIVRGAYHIHSDRSDGSGSVEDIAKAAADAGLKFIILTDHGDGTRTASPPAYLSGVLVIDAVEISTTRGHYAALGVAEAPYPIAGEPADVIEDVRRLGGFGFIAHPDSPRVSLAWQDFHARFDGLEWLNTDTGWRDESLYAARYGRSPRISSERQSRWRPCSIGRPDCWRDGTLSVKHAACRPLRPPMLTRGSGFDKTPIRIFRRFTLHCRRIARRFEPFPTTWQFAPQ